MTDPKSKSSSRLLLLTGGQFFSFAKCCLKRQQCIQDGFRLMAARQEPLAWEQQEEVSVKSHVAVTAVKDVAM